MAVAYDVRLGLSVIAAAAAVLVVALRGPLFPWDLLAVALGGALLLDYGFSNLGFSAAVPVPLADALLIVLLLLLALRRPTCRLRTTPFVLAAGFLALASLRLAVDTPTWGRAALRDFTLAFELGFLLVGYWAMRLYGLDRWVRMLRWVFLLCLAYFALYPWREELAAAGPVVGLQHPVPLLGNYWGAGTAGAAGLFFFALVRPFGRASYLLAAAFVPVLLLVQARAIYVAVPAVAVFLLVAALAAPGRRVWRELAATAAVGGVGLVLVLAHGPEGRLGQVTPGFVTAHVATLWGRDGPSAGTYEHRKQWLRKVIDDVRNKPFGWVTGLGLGPDLVSGFEGRSGVLVRKPHNDYLEVFARLGIAGLLLFCGVLISAWARVLRAIPRVPVAEASFLWWVIASAAIYILVAATQPLFFYAYGTMPLFAALGAGLAIADRAGRNSINDGVRT